MGTNIPRPSMYVPLKGISREVWADLQGGLGGQKKEFPLEIDVRLCTPLGIYQE